jgi:hypothetical protein
VEQVIEGLAATRRDFPRRIWLEVMLVAGMNDSEAELLAVRAAAETIRPDRLHVNTVVRPPAEAEALPLDEGALSAACRVLGPRAEPIARWVPSSHAPLPIRLIALLRRRPCTLSDLASALSADPNEILKWLGQPPACDEVTTERREGVLYYVARPAAAAG